MTQNRNPYILCSAFASLLALAACESPPFPQDAYSNRGDPERLIDLSSESVTYSLATPNALTKLANLVAQDTPSRAELACSLKDTRCTQAKEIFEQFRSAMEDEF